MNKKYNKEDILLTGLYLIRRQGYHNTGVSDILQRSGIPKGSFYNFFKSKEDFTVQLLELYGQRIDSLLYQALTPTDEAPLKRIIHFYSLLMKAYADEEARNGCLVMNLATEAGGYNDNLAKTADIIFQGWIQQLAVVVREGQQQGSIRNSETPEDLATFIHLAFYGALVRSKIMRSVAPQRDILMHLIQYVQS
ncbi:MAG: TetR family transcriptional regulator C-terminal domain-containing protein [Saprospiraceae bacterium]|nr:TetR family transcriptional regulator C-terminal domain-containing protein [Saprospiraceae bacterium]